MATKAIAAAIAVLISPSSLIMSPTALKDLVQ